MVNKHNHQSQIIDSELLLKQQKNLLMFLLDNIFSNLSPLKGIKTYLIVIYRLLSDRYISGFAFTFACLHPYLPLQYPSAPMSQQLWPIMTVIMKDLAWTSTNLLIFWKKFSPARLKHEIRINHTTNYILIYVISSLRIRITDLTLFSLQQLCCSQSMQKSGILGCWLVVAIINPLNYSDYFMNIKKGVTRRWCEVAEACPFQPTGFNLTIQTIVCSFIKKTHISLCIIIN